MPYFCTFLMSFSAKLYQCIEQSGHWKVVRIRKTFNTLGMIGAALMFMVMPLVIRPYGQVLLLCAAASFVQLIYNCGFFLSFSDVGGVYAGLLYGFSNMMSQFSGVVGSLAVAALAPNVRCHAYKVYVNDITYFFHVTGNNSRMATSVLSCGLHCIIRLFGIPHSRINRSWAMGRGRD